MDDAIRQAIADLSALVEGADREDAERIRELIKRLQNFDAREGSPLRAVQFCPANGWDRAKRVLTGVVAA